MNRKRYFYFVLICYVLGILIWNSDLFATDPLTHLPHAPIPPITGDEPGATTTLGDDGSVTTTVTTESTDYPEIGTSKTTTTTHVTTLNEDGTQTTSTTTTVVTETTEEYDQDGSINVDTETVTTTTIRDTDLDGNTTTTTEQDSQTHHGHYPADYDPERDADDMYADHPEESVTYGGITTTTTDSDGNTTTTGLGAHANKVTTTTNAQTGETTTSVTDLYGNPISSDTTHLDGSTTHVEHNEDGSTTTTHTGRNGSSVSTTQHENGSQVTEVSNAEGMVTERTTYDADGNPLVRERFHPDGDRVETIFMNGKKWRSVVYDKNGKIIGEMYWPPFKKPVSHSMSGGTEPVAETGDSTGIFQRFDSLKSPSIGPRIDTRGIQVAQGPATTVAVDHPSSEHPHAETS